jgi:magnesium transporter
MHPADVAFVLEALPPEDRWTVWDQIDRDRAGLVLMEVSGAVRAWLVERTNREALVSLLSTLDPEDLGYISEEIPPGVLEGASRLLELRDRQAFEATVRFDEGHVGHYMTHEWVAVPETLTVPQAIGELRSRGELPPQTDRLFVVDVRNVLRGSVPLQTLLLTDPSAPVISAVAADTVSFEALE